jgi:acyl-coenzyme A synthetase/AMP-(fatty) acid ligase
MKPPRNIGLLLEHAAGAARPTFVLDRPYDIAPDGGQRYDVAATATLVAETSAVLWQAGLRRGDRLAIVKDNHFDNPLLAAAAARIGALPAMISDAVAPEALAVMMQRLAPRVLVASPAVLTAAAAAGVRLVGPETRVVAVGAGERDVPGAVAFADLHGGPTPAPDPVPDDEPMMCFHTSGTTGVPKLVAHSAATLLGVLTKLETMRIPFLSTRPDDVIATCISFVHGRAITWTYAQIVRPAKEVVVLAGSDPATVVPLLCAHPPTTLEACPNIFQRWEGLPAAHPEAFRRIRAYVNTFDAVHPRTVRTFLHATPHRMPVWGQVWGQSEVGPATMGLYTRRSVRDGRARAATSNVGRPIPIATRVRVVDPETRRRVRRGEQGLVLVRTRGRCLTYLGEEDRHAAKDWDGWWCTGDIGARTRSGALRIVDREVDLIPGASGIALESALLDRLPHATEVIVLGVPGRLPVPVVSTQDGALDADAWRTATADLPPLADPVVIGWEDFPRTATWKVRRPSLRRQLLATSETHGTGRWT